MWQATSRVAHIERLALLSRAETNDSGLSRRWPFAAIRPGFGRAASECVRSPYTNVIKVAETDSRTDFPYLSDAAACRAQALFAARDYAGLEEMFEAAGTGVDFAGNLSMAPLRAGLADFFEYGPHSVETNLGRLVDWRRAFPESVLVGPLEAEVFSAWAWQARGTGFARDVTPQAWQLYSYRNMMARAALDSGGDSVRSPLWYQAWLDISVDTSTDQEELLAKFAEAEALYPRYYALHRAVIRSLLPRWGGSHEDVMDFIDDQVRKAPAAERDVLYARLIWAYVDMESTESNVFRRPIGAPDWSKLQRGFATLLERYPDSDYLLNGFARIACSADSFQDYRQLRPQLEARKSATAWTIETTREVCDKKLLPRTE